MKIKSNAIRQAARAERCTFEIVGVCNGDEATTVFAHLPDETNGMGTKSCDLSGAFGCSACHDAIDDRTQPMIAEQEREWYMRRAQTRTWRRLIELGVITIKGARS
ncbi:MULTISPECIES: nuclease domain-containing protein [Halomonadaceae]|uniref:nuclease domain-containing protein n=1 Tax=Halomonadaceae TaxID=28256 RepID=UPI00159B5A6F|nr:MULTISPECIES: nuclease domain-containing protein [Halomonas]QJQ93935.1 DUF1364 family protein [Halomonas sp. PA5]